MIIYTFFACVLLATSQLFCVDHAIVGAYAVRMSTGEVLVDQNSHLSLTPASCMKVITTAAALHLLGADSRFETHLEYSGSIDTTKTLHGNLYIRGGGDPCLGSERLSLSWEKQVEAWADAIQALGIQKIDGKVIGDATRWEKALAVPSWTWEDLGNYFGAGACALSFHENAYSLFFKPGSKVGEPASILHTDPPLSTLIFQNEVTTGPEGSGDQAWIYGSEFSSLRTLRGTIPAAVDQFAIKGAIPNPAAYCAECLTQELQKRGIAIKQQDLAQASHRTIFHTSYSPTIGEIVYWTNQKSINLYAEHLLKKMGEITYGEGSTAAGIQAVTTFWNSQINLEGFQMADGSGLSRKNLVTPQQFVGVLLKMKESVLFPLFLESLVEQKGGIRKKSGYMSLVAGCVGYKGDIAFAILANQHTSHEIAKEKITAFLSGL